MRPLDGPLCRTCGVPVPAGGACPACRDRPPAFDRARGVAPLEGVTLEAVRRLKYAGRRSLAGPLSDLLLERDPYAGRTFGAVVAVPLAERRLRERGYNQAALLARRWARGRGIPYRARCLERIEREGADRQVRSRRGARFRNVEGAFRVRSRAAIAGRDVLLVDDVLTTGATADACARALRDAGAIAVSVLAVARTLPGRGPTPREPATGRGVG